MAKRFSKRVTRKTQRKVKPEEVNNIIEKDFIDSRGNKIKIKFDFNPHPISEPTFKWQRDYGDNK